MSSGNIAPLHPDTVLILAAHGSSRRPEANALIDAHAKTIAARHIFSHVHTVFLMGGPEPHDVAQNITAQRIIIVPFMMSDGYLVDTITEKLRSAIPGDKVSEILVADAIGTHPDIAQIATDMAVITLQENAYKPENSTVVLVAHGAKERPESKSGAMVQLNSVQNMRRFAAVHLALLEETPFLDDVIKDISGPSAVVGLFAAPGGHAIDDVQSAIINNGRADMLDTGPIGADPRMIDITVDRALSKIS